MEIEARGKRRDDFKCGEGLVKIGIGKIGKIGSSRCEKWKSRGRRFGETILGGGEGLVKKEIGKIRKTGSR